MEYAVTVVSLDVASQGRPQARPELRPAIRQDPRVKRFRLIRCFSLAGVAAIVFVSLAPGLLYELELARGARVAQPPAWVSGAPSAAVTMLAGAATGPGGAGAWIIGPPPTTR